MGMIDLMLDEENELTFQLNIEGSRPAEAQCRLVLENTDMSLSFDAHKHVEGEVSVVLPPLAHVLKEGKYDMSLEVIVDDKYFKPLTIEGNFEKSITITAEAVTRTKRKKPKASATLVEVKKDKSTTRKRRFDRSTSKKIVENDVPDMSKLKEVTDKDILEIIKALTKK